MERGGNIDGAAQLGALTAYRDATPAEYIAAMHKFVSEAQMYGIVRGATFYLDATINIMNILPLNMLVLDGCEFVLLSKNNFDSIINIMGTCSGLTLQACHYTRLKPFFKKP